jgi:hypothetical protein
MLKHTDRLEFLDLKRRATDANANDIGARSESGALRRRAEQRLNRSVSPINGETDALHLLHELRVHQIELDMQNEELRAARMEVETTLARYVELYDFSPSAHYTVDRNSEIRHANLAGTRLLGLESWNIPGPRLSSFVCEESIAVFKAFLAKVFDTRVKMSCRLALRVTEDLERHVLIEAACSKHGQMCHLVAVDIGSPSTGTL